MPVYPVDLRGGTYKIGRGDVRVFKPYGKITTHGDLGFETASKPLGRSNPMRRSASAVDRVKRPTQGAKLIMGFNIRGVPPKDIEATRKKAMALVERLRREEVAIAFDEGTATPSPAGGDIGASFLEQRGYWHPVGEPQAYEEGLQIAILNTIQEDPDEFRNDMEVIAEELATEFDQDIVVVEHQERGLTEETVFIERKK